MESIQIRECLVLCKQYKHNHWKPFEKFDITLYAKVLFATNVVFTA